MTPFFEITTRGVAIPSLKVKKFFKENDIYKYSPSKDSIVYVQVKDKKVQILKKDKIIEKLFKFVDEYDFKDEDQKEMVHDKLSRQTSWAKTNLNNWIDESSLTFIKDTPGESYFFFRNVIVKITASEITTHEYSEFESNVWEEHIIDRDFTLDQPSCYADLKGPFHTFLYTLSKMGSEDFESLLSIIGYIIHRYKDPARAKCVIFYDANVNQERPNGRSGKTLLCKSFNEVRNVILENARSTDPTTKFAFNRVNLDTNGIVFDDIPKNLRFEKFFSIITGDFTKEEKFEDRVTIPFADSPKIILTSNYIVQGEGISHSDRRVEFFLTDAFDDQNTPFDHFGKRFFEQWDDSEFNLFFNTMVMSVQYYLQNGLVEPVQGRYYYILKNSAPEGFIEKCEAYLTTDERYVKVDLLDEFRKSIPILESMQQYTFTGLLKQYADYKGWKVEEPHSGVINYITFIGDDEPDEVTEAEA
jgi:hypothetical protein